MATKKKVQKRSTKVEQYRPLTVGDLEKESGTKFRVPSNTKAATYLTSSGLPSLGKLLERVEHKLAQ
jgi:hypothetical protein